MLVLVFIYGNETMIWKEKERSRIMDIRKNSLRASLGIRKIDKILNTLIKERCGVTKGSLKWFEYIKIVCGGRFTKECTG